MTSHLVNDVSSSVFLAWSVPHLLSFQELPVGGDLNVQRQLDVHELLVLAHLPSHVLLGTLEGILQVLDSRTSISHSQLPTLLCLCDLGLKVLTLQKE